MSSELIAIIVTGVLTLVANLLLKWVDKRKTPEDKEKVSLESADMANSILQDTIKALREQITYLETSANTNREHIMSTQEEILKNQGVIIENQKFIIDCQETTKKSAFICETRLQVLAEENIELMKRIESLKLEVIDLKTEIASLQAIIISLEKKIAVYKKEEQDAL